MLTFQDHFFDHYNQVQQFQRTANGIVMETCLIKSTRRELLHFLKNLLCGGDNFFDYDSKGEN